jgi:hypothetical protein
MSVHAVRKRFIELLVEGRGRVSEAAYGALVAFAREGGLSPAERAALTDPAVELGKSRVLREHGVRLEDIRFDQGAWKIAEALAREFALPSLFPGIVNARPAAPQSPPPPATAETLSLRAALDRGRSLGPLESWHVQTAGAELSFVSRVGGHAFPAVVFDLPVWKDPAPRDLLADQAGTLARLRDLAGLRSFIRELVQRERAYLDADGVTTRSKNERYGIQELRRAALFGALAKAQTAIHENTTSLLLAERETLACGRDYDMDVGSHTNYWPYWNNYRKFLDRVLAQTAPESDEALVIGNRIADILDRKTVFGWNRQIDEQDFEVSIGGALVRRLPYTAGPGKRVSLAADSTPLSPKYELDGQPVPREELGVRPLLEGETARPGIAFDWTRDGEIELRPVEIGWWGHCHNEAPLNAMGLDPKKPVELYRADPRVPAEARRQTYSSDDIWDVAGALAADHEQGWALPGYQLRATEVEREPFVGHRNDGGHWLLIAPGSDRRRIRIECEITELWHKSDPTQKYASPLERFRRDLPADDGSFAPNPDWIDAGARDDDEITIDAKGRKLSCTTTYVTLEQGRRVQKKDQLTLDPASDAPLKLADEITDTDGKITEHWYQPQSARYFQVVRRGREELTRTQPVVAVQVCASQETTYDSVIEIHDFVMQKPGLPFVFDTSSGLAVWNYPVKRVRIDRVKEVEKDGFSYTTYHLAYDTMGGPSSKAGYIIKRDAAGNPERALALDPMPDFAFRQEHWVCAPAAADTQGRMAINVQALRAGYLTDKSYEKIIPELWRRQATLLYASLTAESERAFVFETAEGELIAFRDQASFEAAIAANR